MKDQIQAEHNRDFVLTEKQREAFLAGVHVGVMSLPRKKLTPLTLPVCYGYEPGGEVIVIIEADSFKAKLVERAGRFSLCVQDETPPWVYVSVEGPVTGIDPGDIKRDMGPMFRRYLGDRRGKKYVDLLLSSPGEVYTPIVVARMRPEHWWTTNTGLQDFWQQIMAEPAT